MEIKTYDEIVIGSSNDGGLRAPAGHGETHIVDTGIGGDIVAAWWNPLDNLNDLPAFQMISVAPHERDQVAVTIQGSHRSGLLRLRLYLLVKRN